MAGYGTRTVRLVTGPGVFGSSGVPAGTFVIAGRSYTAPAAGSSIDVPLMDGMTMAANGFMVLGLSGATANRPAIGDLDWNSLPCVFLGVIRYFDLTLGVWIHSDPSSATGWRNSTTFAAA